MTQLVENKQMVGEASAEDEQGGGAWGAINVSDLWEAGAVRAAWCQGRQGSVKVVGWGLEMSCPGRCLDPWCIVREAGMTRSFEPAICR